MSIEVVELTKVYGSQKSVNNLSFSAGKGEITGFLGPNGAGKSTTMKIATGYLSPTAGDVIINGVSVTEDPIAVKKMVGYLPEHNPLYLDMYIREFLLFVGSAYNIPRKERAARIDEVIVQCGLSPEIDKKIRMLSKGFRQRVGLAKALLPDPTVLILDEPTTGLDPNQIVEIRDLIKRVSADKTVLLSTHIMQEVEAICKKVVIINNGVLKTENLVSDLTGSPKTSVKFKVEFESAIDKQLFDGVEGLKSLVSPQETLLVLECEEVSVRKRILKVISDNDLPMVSINQHQDSMEEVFRGMTDKG